MAFLTYQIEVNTDSDAFAAAPDAAAQDVARQIRLIVHETLNGAMVHRDGVDFEALGLKDVNGNTIGRVLVGVRS
jgi:hypothetical protein